MTRLGIVVRNNNKGLGVQSWEAYRHLQPARTMIISLMEDEKDYSQRFTAGTYMRIWGAPTPEECDVFLRDIDTLLMFETPYTYNLLRMAKDRGIKTVLAPNYELCPWINQKDIPRPDLFIVPSKWHYDEYPGKKVFLPTPIATERFTETERIPVTRPTRILHVAGMPAANDRNGTDIVLESAQYITSNIILTITTQKKDWLDQMMRKYKIPRNVSLRFDTISPDNYWELYNEADLLVLPRRYGGQSLPVNEALGAGIPVIMPDISPNEWLPKEWLVPAIKQGSFKPRLQSPSIDYYKTDPRALAAKIDEFVTDTDLYQASLETVQKIREDNSWEKLLPLYKKVLQ